VVAAEMVQTQEARIAALERLVGKLVLENEFLNRSSPKLDDNSHCASIGWG
jgi:hypothetical protein